MKRRLAKFIYLASLGPLLLTKKIVEWYGTSEFWMRPFIFMLWLPCRGVSLISYQLAVVMTHHMYEE
jgi:hypothetical protein